MNMNGGRAARLVEEGTLNLVCTRDPFLKQVFLEELVAERPAIYLDFDLLYSGYVNSKLASRNRAADLHQVHAGNLTSMITRTARIISREERLVILDSLNGLYGLPGTDRTLNAYVMMLAAMAGQSGSRVVCSCMVSDVSRNLILSPPGIPLVQIGRPGVIDLRADRDGIRAELLREDLSPRISAVIRPAQ